MQPCAAAQLRDDRRRQLSVPGALLGGDLFHQQRQRRQTDALTVIGEHDLESSPARSPWPHLDLSRHPLLPRLVSATPLGRRLDLHVDLEPIRAKPRTVAVERLHICAP